MERTRCTLCRNPIKPHHAMAGPNASYHEDCWPLAHAEPVSALEQQRAYERQIAERGLLGLLGPYVSVFPPTQQNFTPHREHARERARELAREKALGAQESARPEVELRPARHAALPADVPRDRKEDDAPVAPTTPTQPAGPNFVIVGR